MDVKFSPAELEFCAENELIYVCPTVSTPRVFSFLSGNFGPLVAGVNVQVPLWLAVTLKESNKARIVLPDWMRQAKLDAIIAEEENLEVFYTGLPFHYVEIAELILRVAEDDCAAEGESVEVLSDKLQHLIRMREKKLQVGAAVTLTRTKDPEMMEDLQIKVTGVAAMEVAGIRDGLMLVRRARRRNLPPQHTRLVRASTPHPHPPPLAPPRRRRLT